MKEEIRSHLETLLAHTSRSFSLGIMSLDQPIRDQICLGYLLCRIFDTYEDTVEVAIPVRLNCLTTSQEMLRLLAQQPEALDPYLATWARWHDFEANWGIPACDPWERRLLDAGDLVWRELRELPVGLRQAFSDSLQDMLSGMIEEVQKRQRDHVMVPRTLEETDRYCYSVAGTVGRLLTSIFEQSHALHSDDMTAREGVEFGKALQLVNILKDFHKDWRAGRCFWPGLEMPKGQNLPAPQSVQLEHVFALLRGQFQKYLISARSYVNKIDSCRKDLKFFCDFPLRMAEATLLKATEDMEWLRTGGTFKVSRWEVAQMLLSTPRS